VFFKNPKKEFPREKFFFGVLKRSNQNNKWFPQLRKLKKVLPKNLGLKRLKRKVQREK